MLGGAGSPFAKHKPDLTEQSDVTGDKRSSVQESFGIAQKFHPPASGMAPSKPTLPGGEWRQCRGEGGWGHSEGVARTQDPEPTCNQPSPAAAACNPPASARVFLRTRSPDARVTGVIPDDSWSPASWPLDFKTGWRSRSSSGTVFGKLAEDEPQ